MSETFQLVTVLVVISIISGVTLSLTFDATDPIIQQNKFDELMRALSDVLPANSFEEIDITSDNILKVYKGFDKSGEVVGLVVLSERAGFQSYIKTLTGIDLETRRITRVKILEHLETPGLGARIEEEGFLSGFDGHYIKKSEVDAVSGATVDAITGATISSGTVIGIVKESAFEVLGMISEGKIEGVKLE